MSDKKSKYVAKSYDPESGEIKVPSALTDYEDGRLADSPTIGIKTDDLMVAMTMSDYMIFTYTACDKCSLRSHGCEFYREHERCQLEQNLFKEHIRDLKMDGVNIRDKALVMTSFIHLKELWRTAAKIAIFSEDYELDTFGVGDKLKVEISKFLHKTTTDHTRQLLSTLKELAATRKERGKSVKGDGESEFSVFLAGLRNEEEEK